MFRSLKYLSLFRLLFKKGPISLSDIESKGLLAVKIAQMYAVRSDLLDIEKCNQLQSLYESSTPISWERFQSQLQVHAPPSFWEHIDNIDPKPLATASLGQVHLGTHKNGQQVAIKVIKPEAKRNFEKDLKAFKLLCHGLIFFYPKLKKLADPISTVETIAKLTRTELDLLNEPKGTDTLIEIRNKAPHLKHLHKLHFPTYHEDLSSTQVLVSDYLTQKSVSKGLQQNTFSYEQTLNLFRTQGYFVFLHAQFHGDLHPGNIFFEGDHLWFLDNANIEKTNPKFSKGLLRFMIKLGEKEYLAASEAIAELSLTPATDKLKYTASFLKLYEGFQSQRHSLTNQMMETVKLCVHSGMSFPEGAFSVIKSLMYLDGIALKCAPEADLLQDVLSYSEDLL